MNSYPQRSAREKLEFIKKYVSRLSPKTQEAARQFIAAALVESYQFTPNQLNYIDGIYEKVMGLLGFPEIKVKTDPKRRI